MVGGIRHFISLGAEWSYYKNVGTVNYLTCCRFQKENEGRIKVELSFSKLNWNSLADIHRNNVWCQNITPYENCYPRTSVNNYHSVGLEFVWNLLSTPHVRLVKCDVGRSCRRKNSLEQGKIELCEAVDRCLIYCLTTLSVGAVDIWRRILW